MGIHGFILINNRSLVHVLVDLLQKRVQRCLCLCLLDLLHQLGVLCHQLPQVSHLLQQLGKEYWASGWLDCRWNSSARRMLSWISSTCFTFIRPGRSVERKHGSCRVMAQPSKVHAPPGEREPGTVTHPPGLQPHQLERGEMCPWAMYPTAAHEKEMPLLHSLLLVQACQASLPQRSFGFGSVQFFSYALETSLADLRASCSSAPLAPSEPPLSREDFS